MCVWYYLILYAKLNMAAVQHSSTNFTANFDLTEAARRFDKWTKWTLVKSCQSLSHFTHFNIFNPFGWPSGGEWNTPYIQVRWTDWRQWKQRAANSPVLLFLCILSIHWNTFMPQDSCSTAFFKLETAESLWERSGNLKQFRCPIRCYADTNHLPRANKSRWRHNLYSPETRDVDHEDRPIEGTECPGSKSTSWNNPNVDITKDLKFIEISSVL